MTAQHQPIPPVPSPIRRSRPVAELWLTPVIGLVPTPRWRPSGLRDIPHVEAGSSGPSQRGTGGRSGRGASA
jgi:hypothetical protein